MPAPRDFTYGKLNYPAGQLRGTGFYVANQQCFEHLWSNIVPGDPNALSMPSVETHMGA